MRFFLSRSCLVCELCNYVNFNFNYGSKLYSLYVRSSLLVFLDFSAKFFELLAQNYNYKQFTFQIIFTLAKHRIFTQPTRTGLEPRSTNILSLIDENLKQKKHMDQGHETKRLEDFHNLQKNIHKA